MNIIIHTIPHANQRYETPGDWQILDGGNTIQINVSDLGDWREEALIAVHELVEVLLCKSNDITTEKVDDFDKKFEEKRKQMPELTDCEPGDEPNAPYVFEHCIATGIERQLCALLGLSWKEYEEHVNTLHQ